MPSSGRKTLLPLLLATLAAVVPARRAPPA